MTFNTHAHKYICLPPQIKYEWPVHKSSVLYSNGLKYLFGLFCWCWCWCCSCCDCSFCVFLELFSFDFVFICPSTFLPPIHTQTRAYFYIAIIIALKVRTSWCKCSDDRQPAIVQCALSILRINIAALLSNLKLATQFSRMNSWMLQKLQHITCISCVHFIRLFASFFLVVVKSIALFWCFLIACRISKSFCVIIIKQCSTMFTYTCTYAHNKQKLNVNRTYTRHAHYTNGTQILMCGIDVIHIANA